MLENGEERRFGPGDVGFFPAGTTCTWRVATYILKVAVLRESIWRPLGYCLKAWKKILRMLGLLGEALRRSRIVMCLLFEPDGNS